MDLLGAFKKILSGGLRQLPAPLSQLPAEYEQEKIRRQIRYRAQHVRRDDAHCKVFGIGLSRTGTTSLAEALRGLGYEVLHWTRDERVLSWPDFYFADGATDTPCCAHFESLYHTFERSKFIYTVRDVDEWTRSVQRHFQIESPREFRERWFCGDDLWEGTGRWRYRPADYRWHNAFWIMQIHECLYAGHDSWAEAFHAYDERVRHFFADKPDDRFMRINIPDGDGWEALCAFLGREVPDRPFPHANQS